MDGVGDATCRTIAALGTVAGAGAAAAWPIA
jgi:hypothetical protein